MPTMPPVSIPQQAVYIGGKRYTRNVYNATQADPSQRQTGLIRLGSERVRVWRVGTTWLTSGGLAAWGLTAELRPNES